MVSNTQILEYLYQSARYEDEDKLCDHEEKDEEEANDEGDNLIVG